MRTQPVVDLRNAWLFLLFHSHCNYKDDSKDSQHIKEELPREWFYDEYTNEMDGLEEPKSPADDEYDYDPRYGSKKRRRRRQPNSKFTKNITIGEGMRKSRQSGNGVSRRGRRRTTASEKTSNNR